jgi:hypothetical protein
MTTYRRPPGVTWVVDRGSLVVSDGQGGVHRVTYPEAAVWDFLSRGYSFGKIVLLTGHVAATDHAGAERIVRDALDAWTRAGLLERLAS